MNSAYKSLVVESFEPKDTCWGLIWKLAAPQRVSQFLCLVVSDRLLINFKRSRRGLVDAATCAIYGNAEETTIHSLRDCYCARAIWGRSVPSRMQGIFFGMDLRP
ncbi:hypothetical protein PVK06_048856 [Gossypium arboreum]|uniref:Reverse transcriptase zinc-binding domain-containing protein n=1 Tax=Gossypium arboreum TaxID=29729 RepID=A0ABR0MHL1_GOSAR|nr:hypothetical protein PVK06_048856 [Gossypium arboreum]